MTGQQAQRQRVFTAGYSRVLPACRWRAKLLPKNLLCGHSCSCPRLAYDPAVWRHVVVLGSGKQPASRMARSSKQLPQGGQYPRLTTVTRACTAHHLPRVAHFSAVFVVSKHCSVDLSKHCFKALTRCGDVLCRSTYSKHPHKEPWVLSKVVGEPLSWDPLEAISPEHPPEAIVAAQVDALRWVGVRFISIVTCSIVTMTGLQMTGKGLKVQLQITGADYSDRKWARQCIPPVREGLRGVINIHPSVARVPKQDSDFPPACAVSVLPPLGVSPSVLPDTHQDSMVGTSLMLWYAVLYCDAVRRECDFNVAYSLTSPVGRAVAGTRDRFRAALQVRYTSATQIDFAPIGSSSSTACNLPATGCDQAIGLAHPCVLTSYRLWCLHS